VLKYILLSIYFAIINSQMYTNNIMSYGYTQLGLQPRYLQKFGKNSAKIRQKFGKNSAQMIKQRQLKSCK